MREVKINDVTLLVEYDVLPIVEGEDVTHADIDVTEVYVTCKNEVYKFKSDRQNIIDLLSPDHIKEIEKKIIDQIKEESIPC